MGISLAELFSQRDNSFSLKTILMLATQMLTCIEYVHSAGYLHRDIKPANFLLGTGEKRNRVHIIDFGLSSTYLDSSGEHIPYRENTKFRGTKKYASINNHLKVEASRKDDLESLGYVLIYWLKSELPWENIEVDPSLRRQLMGDIKMATPIAHLTAGLPVQFERYATYVRALNFSSKPSYDFLRLLFLQCLASNQLLYDNRYDWDT